MEMSEHPNVILMAKLTPDNTSRKTMRDILAAHGITDSDDDIKIADSGYHHVVMESDYEDGYQIGAKEGDLVFFDLVTYGYGETIVWEKLQSQKDQLEAWAKDIGARFKCSYEIHVTANYW
jgi:hypothetical protein